MRDLLAELRVLNETAEFNRWCGLEVVSAAPGLVEIAMPWRKESGQYSGFLHAGIVATLVETACGYAAGSLAGPVLTGHFSVNCLRPAKGDRFLARAQVIRAGKTQIFTACQMFASSSNEEKLVATGEAILCVVNSGN